jgi:hypothetical protein
MWRLWERQEMHTEFWWGNTKDHSDPIGIDGKIILKYIFKKTG